jgi:ubiquinone biosynthesis protein
MAEVLEPYPGELVVRQYSPRAFARSVGRAGIEASQLGVELPQRLRRLLADLERGGVEVSVRPTGPDPMLARLGHAQASPTSVASPGRTKRGSEA